MKIMDMSANMIICVEIGFREKDKRVALEMDLVCERLLACCVNILVIRRL